jgi:hypothetical protein
MPIHALSAFYLELGLGHSLCAVGAGTRVGCKPRGYPGKGVAGVTL